MAIAPVGNRYVPLDQVAVASGATLQLLAADANNRYVVTGFFIAATIASGTTAPLQILIGSTLFATLLVGTNEQVPRANKTQVFFTTGNLNEDLSLKNNGGVSMTLYGYLEYQKLHS